MPPSSCSDCNGVGYATWEVRYRDHRMGSETIQGDRCEPCDGTGVYPPAYHIGCGGSLRFPLHGEAECSDCLELVRLAGSAVTTARTAT